MIAKYIVVPLPNGQQVRLKFTQEQDDSNNWTCHVSNEFMEDVALYIRVEEQNE